MNKPTILQTQEERLQTQIARMGALELSHMVRALASMPILNTPDENLRLQYARDELRKRGKRKGTM